MISSEDFAIWRANTITEAVFKWLAEARDGLQQRWVSHSWDGGDCDPVVLAQARGGAAMANDILELKADDLNEDKE